MPGPSGASASAAGNGAAATTGTPAAASQPHSAHHQLQKQQQQQSSIHRQSLELTAGAAATAAAAAVLAAERSSSLGHTNSGLLPAAAVVDDTAAQTDATSGSNSHHQQQQMHEKKAHSKGGFLHNSNSSTSTGNGSAPGKHQQNSNALLTPIPPEQQLNLRWEHICAHVSTDYDEQSFVSKSLQRCRGQTVVAHEKKQILHSVCGEMVPGELLAFMGPSGSGKTSLLSIIAGRAAKAVETKGRVTSGGVRLTKAAKRRIGFVLQDDLLYETLTVWETLTYAAALRLPRTMSKEQRHERVQAVISALGLNKCVDTIIGGFFRRGISGGERKRVSIGHELLINPALMLLDEPTSGLDSTTALHLLVTLKQLAEGGRAIATTIHQPSSRLYQQLDRLMLLAEGHVVYYGPSAAVVPWFAALGFAMPYGVNVADFLLDLAQGEVEGGNSQRLLPASSSSTAAAAAGRDGKQDKHEAADTHKQQQQQHLPLLQSPSSPTPGAAAAVSAGGDLALSGPPAIVALYSSYEHFAATHRDGFEGEHQLQDLHLALEPPPTRQQLAAAAAAAAAASNKGAFASSSSFISRSFNKAGSFLRLESLGGGGDKSDKNNDSYFDANSSDDPELGQPISRAWSRSRSFVGQQQDGGLQQQQADREVRGCWGELVHNLGVADRGGASFFTQWKVLLSRSIKVKRFESLSSQRFFQGVAVAVITGVFWWQRGRGTSLLAASDIIGLLFFELLFPAFTAMFTALFVFPNDFRMLLKERASGMYRVSAFYLASACSDLPMDCAYPVLFVVIIYLMGGLKLTAAAFFANLFSLVLNVLTAQSLGLLLGAAVMNPKTAQTIASVLMLAFMLVGGYYVRGIPPWAAWLRYLSFVYWGFNLLLKIQFRDSTYIQCGGSTGLGTGAEGASSSGSAGGVQPCHPVTDLQAALQLPTNPNESPALEVGVLLGMLFVMRLLVYVTLRHKTKSV